VTGHDRAAVAALALLGVLAGVVLLVFASGACPSDTPAQPCPAAASNRAVVIGLAAASAGMVVTAFALLAEFAARRRILYRGAWSRAARRGVLAGITLAALAGLRLAGALSVPGAIFVVLIGLMLEWFAIRRLDSP
jgi:hypothetical protein